MYVDAILPNQSRHALGWHLLITTNQTPSSLICIFMRAWKALVPLLRVGSMKSLCINESLYIYIYRVVEPEIFVWGSSCSTNIFIKITLYTHIYTYTLFYYIYTHIYTHIFLFHKLYLYIYIHTHTQQQQKNLVFSIKIIFDGDIS